MIDYEEELKKFEPCLDVADAEGAIYDRELTDILDVLQEVLIISLFCWFYCPALFFCKLGVPILNPDIHY